MPPERAPRTGKLVAAAILGSALLVGGGIWYAQTRGYYAPVEGPVTLTLAASDGSLTTLPATEVRAIASDASPLGFRACFATPLDQASLGATIAVEARGDAEPTIAPGWFPCFDAGEVADLLASGGARAYTAFPNARFGVDRIVALAPDGRGWAWHQLNECGERSYDGTPVGEACPDRDTFAPLTEGAL